MRLSKKTAKNRLLFEENKDGEFDWQLPIIENEQSITARPIKGNRKSILDSESIVQKQNDRLNFNSLMISEP